MDQAIRKVKPGMTEYQIAALLAAESQSRGAQPIVVLIATDERIFNFRHPLPTEKQMERYAMLILCGRRWGLVCSLTRLVHFGRLSDELQKKSRAVAQVDAAIIEETRPGRTLGQIFTSTEDAYNKAGYPDEWKLHHQGGPAGYEAREYIATPGSKDVVSPWSSLCLESVDYRHEIRGYDPGGRKWQRGHLAYPGLAVSLGKNRREENRSTGDIGDHVKVIRLHAPGDLRIHEEPSPIPARGEALLRVSAVGICGSDLHWFNESSIGDARLTKPLVLGHEFAALDERSGRLVAVDPAMPCGRCEFCLEGNPNLCPSVRFAGHAEVDGALRQYLTWPEQNLYPLPEKLDAPAGAMLEPLGVAMHAVDLAHLQPGMQIGVFGCGPIGLLVVQLARFSGATCILATDRLEHRIEAARSMGAHQASPG